MLSYHTQRILRNAYYRVTKIKMDSHYLLFSKLYDRDPRPWPWIYKLDSSNFLLAKFLHPSLSIYQGYEFTQFNGLHLACYWLPGATSGAQGTVACGQYLFKVNKLLSNSKAYLTIKKSIDNIDCEVKNSNEINDVSDYTLAYPNLLNYRIIIPEISALINLWFAYQQHIK